MPVTAKLSRKFYEKFGDDLTNELVEWFNQVDATYRGDLHELNELNFARFDAKLEQRAAQLEAKIEQRAAQLEAKIEQRAAQLEAKFEQRAAQLEAKFEQRIAEVRGEIRTGLANLKAELVRWMFLFWVGTLGTLLALLKL